MRHCVIMAGGSGTRLWPMSRAQQPKQLIPFIAGRSLLQLAVGRLDGLVPLAQQHICAAEGYREQILGALPGYGPANWMGEPMGRDTLAAVGLSAAVVATIDPDASIAVLTADHIIEPVDTFQALLTQAFELVEQAPNTLATFGVAPTGPATGYGYLELGEPLAGAARVVRQFREKPDLATAEAWVAAGPEAYLWNSGTFVWRAATLLDCVARYEPETYAGLMRIAEAWHTEQRAAVLAEVYPALRKISIDFAVMEPASHDAAVRVAAIPMVLDWLDVGSWPTFAKTLQPDAEGNTVAGARTVLHNTHGSLVASSDPNHVVALLGCDDLIVIHTPDATLVCRADQAEAIKEVHRRVGHAHGQHLL
ncbi:MAG: NTP transferase domain-containing protein [Armatimonadetes bacterium]|nr:NTP transferase domain-containing protein [Armatimonadota bacterium]